MGALGVVSKQEYITTRYALGEVINVDQEKEWAKDTSLGDPR